MLIFGYQISTTDAISFFALVFSIVNMILTISNKRREWQIQSKPILGMQDYNYNISWPNNQISAEILNDSLVENNIIIINTTTNTAYNVKLEIDRSPIKKIVNRIKSIDETWILNNENRTFDENIWNNWDYIPSDLSNNNFQAQFIFPIDLLNIYAIWLMKKSEYSLVYTREELLLAYITFTYSDATKKQYKSKYGIYLYSLGGDHVPGNIHGNIGNDGGRVKFKQIR